MTTNVKSISLLEEATKKAEQLPVVIDSCAKIFILVMSALINQISIISDEIHNMRGVIAK